MSHESKTTLFHDCWLVELELKRIQTLLFEVPRLAVTIGTNALVGETLRGLWNGKDFSDSPDSLPHLAKLHHSQMPEGALKTVVSFDRDGDPLMHNGVWQDDVLEVSKATGVLTRDGGHFAAIFASREHAKSFVDAAFELVARKLAGARVEARLVRLEKTVDGCCKRDEERMHEMHCQSVFDLPQAEICELSGAEPATEEERIGNENYCVARPVQERWDRGKAFDDGDTHDVLGILRDEIMSRVRATQDDLANEFKELSTEGYLAVVHVDGNSVGKRFKKHQGLCKANDFFTKWAHEESFFHHLRVGMRKAVLGALETAFKGNRNRQGKLPLRLLMLGGDDLVLVCGAPYALPFVEALADRVKQTTARLTTAKEEKGPLTIAAGVAVVQQTFPFHRAHALAEQLAGSAKRIKDQGSAVDWVVTSEAWHGDIKDTRRTAIVDGELILSMKPYPMLGRDQKHTSLQSLLEHAKTLCGNQSVARGQLQRLTDSLEEGRHTARFAGATLPESTRHPLKEMKYLTEDGDPWCLDGRFATTRLLDLFELYELERLRPIKERKEDESDGANPPREHTHA